ncbi:MAG TPA: pyridoxine 5'-phosphate synthase [Elusimicrobia bacterium]|nr:MAG: pyridoxine 5'-phosphate synthase [Elusimicrobia bacterium GWA2_66_18]OGR77207.1 MAG: pyridoxine 5'-phosphate synthase [Elusimicrobia bacterium GWC2_65_9]HAZ08614.1 pyridoxine 5'-phosphate synthase [Elusimicrobiota bacterium]
MRMSETRIKLGVNIDHIATLRQARKDIDPDPVAAAQVARQAGADMIVCHLRRDRRHIQDADLFKLCRLKGETHVEIADDKRIVDLVLKARPGSVCLVPERPGEVSTEGGLDVARNFKSLEKTVARLKRAGVEASLFIAPEAGNVRAARNLGADVVEFDASDYSAAPNQPKRRSELERLELATYMAWEMGLTVHAGHGLDYHNVAPLARMPHLNALNIGYSIVARSVFVGLKTAVGEMRRMVD